MNSTVRQPLTDVERLIRRAAFHLLIERARAISVAALVAATGIKRDRLGEHLAELARAGRIRRDEKGRVIGSAGLNVTKDRHEIDLDGRQFWTWCAYDILGIFGALEASGRALSPSPDGETIEIRFERGKPANSNAVLFRPDVQLMSCCENVYKEWCPNSNLFSDSERAQRWAVERGVAGRIMELAEASREGASEWSEVVGSQGCRTKSIARG